MANISRNSYNETKQYDKVILQQGSPLTDYDFNEAQDIQRVKLRRIVKELFGDGAIGDGFKVVQAATANQTVVIKAGTLYVQGYRAKLDTDITLNMPAAPTSGSRTDNVYVAVTEQEIDSVQDPEIKHTKLTIEPTRRSKISVTVQVGTSVPVDTDTVKYYLLATVLRGTNDNVISTAEITDTRSVKITFEGDGFSVKGGMTIGDSATDIIDMQGTIKNTSTNNGGVLYIDDAAKITGALEVVGTLTIGTGTLSVVSSKLQSSLDFKSLGSLTGSQYLYLGADANLYRSAANLLKTDDALEVALTFKSTGAATFSSTIAVTGAATLSSTLAVTGNTTLSGTLGVTGATTLSNAVTQSGGNVIFNNGNGDFSTTIKRNSNGTSLFVRQNSTGNIAEFGSDTTSNKLTITNAGGIVATSDITTAGKVTTTGINVQTGKYYEVARVPLFGTAGDIQYQSDAFAWEDVSNHHYYLFKLGDTTRTILPAVPSGATRKYKLRAAFSCNNGTDRFVEIQLINDAGTPAIPLTWTLPALTGSVGGQKMWVESADFTQASDATGHWRIQARIQNAAKNLASITTERMAIYYVELVAFDVY